MQRLMMLVMCASAVACRDGETTAPTLPPGPNETRDGFDFYRSMRVAGKSGRRVFGGNANDISEFPYACALLDVYYSPTCSCSVLSPHWALTAAHCLSPSAAYLKYNTHLTRRNSGDVAVVQFHFRHPRYKVEYSDVGRGVDVSLLHHDVGLLRTKEPMRLVYAPAQSRPLSEMLRYNPVDIREHVVRAYGFGVSSEADAAPPGPGPDPDPAGERLMSIDLRMIFCDRSGWYHCVCGTAEGAGGAAGGGAGGGARGVCTGDSGGPVVYRGCQVAVTSMGPIRCDERGTTGPTGPTGTTSVFTALYNYVDVINRTISDKEHELANMKPLRRRSGATRPSSFRATILLLLARAIASCAV